MDNWDFRPQMWGCAILIALSILVAWGMLRLFGKGEMESSVRLRPIRYELVVNDNKVDTVFIYKKP